MYVCYVYIKRSINHMEQGVLPKNAKLGDKGAVA